MHEMGIAYAILEVVQRYVPKDRARLVRRVRLNIGEDTPVLVESLDFCFSAIIQNTAYASATLDVARVPAKELTVREVELADEEAVAA
jgi:Zn finger protein HypA/HybF involved in hydrogenase expression